MADFLNTAGAAGQGRPQAEESIGQTPLNFNDFIHDGYMDPVECSSNGSADQEVCQAQATGTAYAPPTIPAESSKEIPKPKNGTRFSRAVLAILRGWIEDHRGNPYPDDNQKEWLKAQTGLTSDQITNWFANARRREKIRSVRRRGSFSISPRPNQPIAIVNSRGWGTLDPMERWKNSPPEQDPAPLAAIENAAREYSLPSPSIMPDASWYPSRPGSTGSVGSLQSASDTSSVSAFSATFSQDSHGSFGSFMSHQSNKSKQNQRRRRRVTRERSSNLQGDKSRIFHCTFCVDSFKSKHDWARHEKSLHLSLEKWICTPSGEVVTVSPTGERTCSFCEEIDPSKEHLDGHRHKECFDKGIEGRTFYRKDHLDQHLRLMHNCKITKNMASWKEEITNVRSRCGFCGLWFDTWQQRRDHLAKEYRNGRKMADWKGSRGFDPDTAALVTNSLPPYLIDQESKTPLPFSAGNTSTLLTHQQWSEILAMSYHNQGSSSTPDIGEKPPTTTTPITTTPPNNPPSYGNRIQEAELITFWETSSYYLSQYAQSMMSQGIPVTDYMLQREARRVECGDTEDTWNVTLADDPYWLHLFKQVNGIIPLEREFTLADLIEDFGLIATLAFSQKESSRWSLGAISNDVLQSLDRTYQGPLSQLPGTMPNSFLAQNTVPETQVVPNEWAPLISDTTLHDPLLTDGAAFTEDWSTYWTNPI